MILERSHTEIEHGEAVPVWKELKPIGTMMVSAKNETVRDGNSLITFTVLSGFNFIPVTPPFPTMRGENL